MKKLIIFAATVLSMSAYSFVPSFSNNDFDATVKKAHSAAMQTATSVASARNEKLSTLTKQDSKGLTAVFTAQTSTGCTFDVKVGLFFRTQVENFYYCNLK